MIYDMRTYALRPGGGPGYVALFGAKGLPLLSRHATLVGDFHVETGGLLNHVVHVWRCEGRAERQAGRAALMAEPDWRGFLPEAMPHLLEQRSDLLRLAAFSLDPVAWTAAHPRPDAALPRLYELRTYHLAPGAVPAMLAAYERHAAVFARHLDLVAYWTADGGDLGRVVYLWAYADHAEDAGDANLKLSSELTNIMGVSGRAIIEALIERQTDPEHLLTLLQRGVKAWPEKIKAALMGRITDRHRFLLRLHLRQIDAQDAALADIDTEVDRGLDPFREAVKLLRSIPGVSELTAQVIVSEIGTDMSGFRPQAI